MVILQVQFPQVAVGGFFGSLHSHFRHFSSDKYSPQLKLHDVHVESVPLHVLHPKEHALQTPSESK